MAAKFVDWIFKSNKNDLVIGKGGSIKFGNKLPLNKLLSGESPPPTSVRQLDPPIPKLISCLLVL